MVTVERYFQHHIRLWINELGDNISILDVGCGTGHIGYWLAVEYPLITANCQDKEYDERHKKKNLQITGIDSYQPALKYAKDLGDAYTNLHEIDLRDLTPIYSLTKQTPKNKFDIALAYGVMAHLEKEESLRLVKCMQRIADNIIVTAPQTLLQHEKSHKDIGNDPHIEQLQHKSKYSCDDFEKLGLETRMLAYNESPTKMTTLNTFVSPWTFLLSAVHARIPFRSLHKLNHWGDGMIAWRENKK